MTAGCCAHEFDDSSSVSCKDGLRVICIEGADFKFSCAHFVAFKGFREKLHGHNYTVKVRIGGPMDHDGYVLDFGIVKAHLRGTCKKINESLIVPMRSDVLKITVNAPQVEIRSESGSFFSIPQDDCSLLPIVHSTAEELSEYIWDQLVQGLTYELIQARKLDWMEVTVKEAPTQGSSFFKAFSTRLISTSDHTVVISNEA